MELSGMSERFATVKLLRGDSLYEDYMKSSDNLFVSVT
jgi:hypothetical protein